LFYLVWLPAHTNQVCEKGFGVRVILVPLSSSEPKLLYPVRTSLVSNLRVQNTFCPYYKGSSRYFCKCLLFISGIVLLTYSVSDITLYRVGAIFSSWGNFCFHVTSFQLVTGSLILVIHFLSMHTVHFSSFRQPLFSEVFGFSTESSFHRMGFSATLYFVIYMVVPSTSPLFILLMLLVQK
jgi:hypothetical protein